MSNWIIAHRGSRLKAPENTLKAFETAIQDGADMIELDVRMTRDQVLIIRHDADLDGSLLRTLTWSEVQSLSEKLGSPIPTFSETLDFCRGKILLDIELKEAGYESQIIALLNKKFSPQDCILTSFQPKILSQIRTIDPKWKIGLLLGDIGQGNILQQVRQAIKNLFPSKIVESLNPDYLVPHLWMMHAGFTRWNRTLQIPLLIWTVNKPKSVQSLLKKHAIAGIITDNPTMALQARARFS